MAVNTKKGEFASSLKERLDFLECDYTEDLDEAAVADVLLNPGEGRLKVLQWLFSRYDSKLADLLDPSQLFGSRTDSRLQRLLTAANAMCLCHKEDIALINGEGPVFKQMNFIDRLLDLVCIREKEKSARVSKPSRYNEYLDALVSQDGFPDMFNPKIDLLPRNLRSEVEKNWSKKGWDKSQSLPQPNIQNLTALSESLAGEIKKHNSTLETLQQQVSVKSDNNSAEILTMTQMLATVLRELRQLADGFTHCYESNISQWCHKTPPELSDLGVVFKRVHAFLEKFVKLLEDLNKIRQTQARLGKCTNKESDVGHQIVEQVSREATDCFQQCLTVLEETLHRSDSNFTSKHQPVITL